MRKFLNSAIDYCDAGKDFVLVTIIESAGSTPRGAGAKMIVDKNGLVAGTIGGGIIEANAISVAKKCIENKLSDHAIFEYVQDDFKENKVGEISVVFSYVSSDNNTLYSLFNELNNSYSKNEDTWLIYDISKKDVTKIATYSMQSGINGFSVQDDVIDQLSSNPKIIKCDSQKFYTEKFIKSSFVYIFGGGHISQALVPVLSWLNFRCIVVDDRDEFLHPFLFPGVFKTIKLENAEITKNLKITNNDYICIMTRGHKDDLKVQAEALKTSASYIGVVGSRNKIKPNNQKLSDLGFSQQEIDRIITPIGLEIKAETPAEIAVSIAAQLIDHRAKRSN